MSKMTTITSDDILGKVAVDPHGEVLGVVMKLHIDKENKKLLGLTIDTGFMRPDLFIGMNYIKNFGVDSVFLNRMPTTKLKGKAVITEEGELIGYVNDTKVRGRGIGEIIISKKGIHFKRKLFSIAASDIKEIGGSIIVKKGFKAEKVE